jgi:hypothetical protein
MPKTSPGLRRARGESRGRKAQVKRTGSRPKLSAASSAPRSSKQAEVIALLRRPEGATVAELVAATGWQPHTVRGLFSGTLKKKLGLTLASEREEGGRTYRIVDGGAQNDGAAQRRSR